MPKLTAEVMIIYCQTLFKVSSKWRHLIKGWSFASPPEGNEFYMTREQIGTALNYENPQKAIDNIHVRNSDRLDPLSVTLKLRATDGKYYDTRVYTLRGVMEICRFSRQPNADGVAICDLFLGYCLTVSFM